MLQRLLSSDDDLVGRTALLVDDDARNIFALSSVLERRGMEAFSATTGKEAIATLKTHPDVAIVLMDIMMPKWTATRPCRSSRGIPVGGRLLIHQRSPPRR